MKKINTMEKNTNIILRKDNVEKINDSVNENKRIKSIDRFRGFCVFSMLIFQFLKNFKNLGILSKLADHSLETGIVILPGMTLADIIAPAFIFAIGLTFALSFKKWETKYGLKYAVIHYLERALAIIGVGTFLSLCNKLLDSFSGNYTLNAFDWTVFAFTVIALVGLSLRLLSLIPALRKKLKCYAEQIFYIALSCLGIMNIIITSIDYAYVLNGTGVVYSYWVTLQGIGFAILIALPFIKAKSWIKFLAASLITILFTVYHQIGNNKELLDVIVHGGIVGGFGWGAMLIFDMFIADLFFINKTNSFVVSSVFFSVGIILTQWLGNINMGSCSPTFIIVGVGLSGVVFAIFDYLDKFHKSKFDPLIWWGKNPIIMFLVEFFIIGLYSEVMPDNVISNATLPIALLQGVIAIILLTAFAYWISKSKKSLSL